MLLLVLFSGRIPDQSLKWLFDKQPSSVLTLWTQFDSLLSHFSGRGPHESNWKEELQLYIDGLQGLCEKADDEDHGEKGTVLKDRLQFLVEQLQLSLSPSKKYSCETLLWAFQVNSCAPRTYNILRNTLTRLT